VSSCACGPDTSPVSEPRPRYFPRLGQSPLTFARAFDPTGPATAFRTSPASAASRPKPQLWVRDDQGQDWTILDDLLSSNEFQRVCVVEIERDATAYLRFGDNQFGLAIEPGASFQARYRVGNGTAGNVGHDTLAHILTAVKGITGVRNPMAAAGGVDPEGMESIRQRAPFAFRTQLRAVTESDYGTQAQHDPAIRQARGTLRWTGSWYTAFVSIDASAGGGPTATLIAKTKDRLNLLRMAGVDLEVEAAVIVGLRIELNVCVSPDHFRSDVGAAIVRLFTTGDLCDGRRGILNPENFTFGQTLYTSPLIAAAQGVPGVSSATMAVFQRMDDPSSDGTARGYLTMGRLEIARCDNDPNRLDHGLFLVHLDGGK
jgi:predicted phage baseplate assembly protein